MTAIACILAATLWFHADFDYPVLMGGREVPFNPKIGSVVPGRFGKGFRFVSDLSRAGEKFFSVSDPDLLDSFPFEEGTFSCWVRVPDGAKAPRSSCALWCYGGFWQYQWTWRGDSFSTEDCNSGWKRLALGDKFSFGHEWRHFCATWNARELVCYADGRPIASKKNPTRVDMRRVPRAVFWFGGGGNGCGAAGVDADEVSIYAGALAPDEVAALAAAKGPVLGEGLFFGGRVAFPIFWRNQGDAAIRMRMWCPAAGEYVADLTVRGHAFPPRRLRLKTGSNRLIVPFDPALFEPGEGDWKLTLKAADGRTVLRDGGRLEIRGRVARDAFKINSWGGSTGIPQTNLLTMGFNSFNVTAGATGRGIRAALKSDLFLNCRLENSRNWRILCTNEFQVARDAARTLEPAVGLHLWAMTLVNSEVYGGGMEAATNAYFAAKCREATGIDPDIRVRHPPLEIDFAKKGIAPCRGVMPDGDPTLETVRWYWREGGFPACQMNRVSGETIRRISPGNVVWSEPSPPVPGLDMVADWVYDYKSETALQTMRRQYAHARARHVLNMPTLSMEYWHTYPPSGVHPTARGRDGKPLAVRLAQSCDEVTIKSWMALGAVRCDALGFYAADAWVRGAEGYAAWRASPTNVFATIGEPDAQARYGRFVRERLRPAAELLRGLDGERQPIGVVWFDETQYAGGSRWVYHHYLNHVHDAFARLPVGFDSLREADDLKPETLAKYRYLVLPMMNVVTKAHDALLRNLPPSVRIVTDAHATVTYPNGTCLKAMRYNTDRRGCAKEFNPEGTDEPLKAFFGPRTDELRKSLGAWSDGDGGTSYTFVKRDRGAAYVTVVNNARRAGGSPMNAFNTNGWYRPCGAPARIVTHFNLPGVCYEFNAAGGARRIAFRGARTFAADYAPAEGRVFCLYPRPIARVAAEVTGEAAPGRTVAAQIRVLDARGPVPGRQVLRVTVTDPAGRETDESGLYAAEGGIASVPIRLPLTARAGAWSVRVEELASGIRGRVVFF